MSRETGSVTAEFALLLPAVIAVFMLMLQLLALQVERVQLAQAAGLAARASSHLVDHIEVQQLVRKIAPDATLIIEQDAELICATVTKPGLLVLAEKICTRVQGM